MDQRGRGAHVRGTHVTHCGQRQAQRITALTDLVHQEHPFAGQLRRRRREDLRPAARAARGLAPRNLDAMEVLLEHGGDDRPGNHAGRRDPHHDFRIVVLGDLYSEGTAELTE